MNSATPAPASVSAPATANGLSKSGAVVKARRHLLRYRVAAWVVGCILLLLVLVAMPLKYLADQPFLVEAIGPLHGFAYMAYLVLVYLLSDALQWSWKHTLAVMLAGTVPGLSFWMEHRITGSARHQLAAAKPAQ